MDASYKHPVVAVVGPTATGKTALGVELAKHFSGEVISCDSMQIYKGLDIGTAKVTPEETCGIPHHGVDILTPDKAFSVADFTAMAGKLEEEISARKKLPILVGGTGLYITSLLNGMSFAPEKTDPAIRARLQAQADAGDGAALYARLQQIDPDYAALVHPNNLPRVIRALELYESTGRRMSAERLNARAARPPYRSLCLCLTCRDRAVLYDRIGRRVDAMIESGVLDEARRVYERREAYRTAAQAIGYKEFFPYFAGEQSLADCTEKLKQATRNYAKRQLTWFRRQTDAVWLYLEDGNLEQQAAEQAEAFLAENNA